MFDFLQDLPDWLRPLALLGGAVLLALAGHAAAFALLCRFARASMTRDDDMALARLKRPTRWLVVAIALTAIHPVLGLDRDGMRHWRRIAGIVTPALFGWLAIALLGLASDLLQARADITVADNLRARRRRTRVAILYRIGVFLILLVTLCLMLMSIPSIRDIGVTLIASAGLAGLAVGAAAQPALKNLIAGIQLAFTEPIRIDDVVIVEGEWGRIEEIRLTFVVVKTWDERRLVVPVSRFLEASFQNWTRQTSALLGTVFLQLDPLADIDRVRAKFEALCHANDIWDGRVVGVQVTEVRVDHMEVRGLVSARDAGRTFDLRCQMREAMMAWLRDEMPEALPRRRGDLDVRLPSAPTGHPSAAHRETGRATR